MQARDRVITLLQNRTHVIIAVAAAAALLLGVVALFFVFGGDDGPDRNADFDWLLDVRMKELQALAQPLLDYAAKHGGLFPKDAQALAAAGILTPDKARFRDPMRNVEVQRQYRPGTIPKQDGYFIIVILENYDPNPKGDVLALCSDGEVRLLMGLEETVRHDNGQRKYLKLPEIPWAAP